MVDVCGLVHRGAAVGVELLGWDGQRHDVDAGGNPAVVRVLKQISQIIHRITWPKHDESYLLIQAVSFRVELLGRVVVLFEGQVLDQSHTTHVVEDSHKNLQSFFITRKLSFHISQHSSCQLSPIGWFPTRRWSSRTRRVLDRKMSSSSAVCSSGNLFLIRFLFSLLHENLQTRLCTPFSRSENRNRKKIWICRNSYFHETTTNVKAFAWYLLQVIPDWNRRKI